MSMKKIILAHTQGFCAGVSNAVDVVNMALEKYGRPIYVRHQIVHNTWVIEDFEKKGVIFIENIGEVPDKSVVVFSAHGVSPEIYKEAKDKNIHVVDATCPLVKKIHRQANRYSDRKMPTILIGHKGHQELVGTSGYVDKEYLHIVEDVNDVDKLTINVDESVAFITQTTLSISDTSEIVDKLIKKFPNLNKRPKNDICYATQNRQDAVLELAKECDVVVICGSPNSSNSNRLRETAEKCGTDAYIIDSKKQFNFDWLVGKSILGISSGASVPRYIVDQLVDRVKERYPSVDISEGEDVEAGVQFPLPMV